MNAAISCILFLALLALSGVFSAMEISYASLNRFELERRAAGKKRGSREAVALRIKDNFEKHLSCILLGNNMANIGLESLAAVLGAELLGEKLSYVGTAISAAAVIIFGEITPKLLARNISTTWAIWSAIPLKILHILFLPLTAAFDFLGNAVRKKTAETDECIDPDDIDCAVDEIEDKGIIDDDEAELLHNSIDFEDTSVYEIAVPRVDIEGIDIEDDRDTIMKTVTTTRYSRLIVYKGSRDLVLGAVLTTTLLMFLAENKDADEKAIKDEIEKEMFTPLFFHMTMTLTHAFRIMKKETKHIAVISDEFGGTYGIITMEDLLEDLSGEIWDESDSIEMDIVEKADGSWNVKGDMDVSQFFDETELEESGESERESTTLGGLAFEMLDRTPRKGDSFRFSGLTFTVLKTLKRRVLLLNAKKDAH